jgi:hypothetical protein
MPAKPASKRKRKRNLFDAARRPPPNPKSDASDPFNRWINLYGLETNRKNPKKIA